MKRLAIAVTFAVASAIAAISCLAQEKGIDVDLGNAPHALAGQNVPSGDTGKIGKKNKKAQAHSSGAHDPASSQGNPASPDQLDCGKLPVRQFVVDPSGSVSDTGQNLVGPACVEVFYNPIQNAVFLQSSLAVVAGPDLNKALFGAGAQGGEIPQQIPVNKNISETFHDLYQQEQELRQILDGRKGGYGRALNSQESAIAAIAQLRSTTLLLSAEQQPAAVRNGYKVLRDKLQAAIQAGTAFTPTDQADNRRQVLLSQFQQLANDLAFFPLRFSDAPKVDSNSIAACNPDPTGGPSEKRAIAWADWIGHCKEQYDTLTKQVAADIQEVQNYGSPSDNVKRLRARLAIVEYWDWIFSNMGLRSNMTNAEIDAVDISPSFHASKPVRCGNLFNQTGNTTVNILAADLTPTLDGGAPIIKAQGPFTTVTCATPFAVTAGVAFSTIQQKEFAIVKSNGGPGNPSVNEFQSLNDSRIHPMPIGMVHVRLAEWGNHVYAFHGSLGVAGNFQSQSAGGSSAEFLPSVSFSFWRTMFLSIGPQIGTKSALAGGFKEGDPVPSDITTIQGQVKRSYTVGFGFALTFTKP